MDIKYIILLLSALISVIYIIYGTSDLTKSIIAFCWMIALRSILNS
ncbi:hypothetical protein ACR77J_07180 [Tissierella praeacuta]